MSSPRRSDAFDVVADVVSRTLTLKLSGRLVASGVLRAGIRPAVPERHDRPDPEAHGRRLGHGRDRHDERERAPISERIGNRRGTYRAVAPRATVAVSDDGLPGRDVRRRERRPARPAPSPGPDRRALAILERETFPRYVGEMGARRPFFLGRTQWTQVHEKERELQERGRREGEAPPCRTSRCSPSSCAGPSGCASTSTVRTGVDHALCEEVTGVLRDYLNALLARGVVAGDRAAAPHARALRGARSARRSPCAPRARSTGRRRFRGEVVRGGRGRGHARRRPASAVDVPYDEIVRGNLIDEGLTHEPRDSRGRQGDRAREGDRGGHPRPRARGRPARRLQEDTGRVAPRAGRARRPRGLPRLGDRAARRHRGAPDRGGARARDHRARGGRGRRTASARHTLVLDDDLDIDWSEHARGAGASAPT